MALLNLTTIQQTMANYPLRYPEDLGKLSKLAGYSGGGCKGWKRLT
jgi:hypothetical protein